MELVCIGGASIEPSSAIGTQDIIDLVDFPIPESARIDGAIPALPVVRADTLSGPVRIVSQTLGPPSSTIDKVLLEFVQKYPLCDIWKPTIDIPSLSINEDWEQRSDNISLEAFTHSTMVSAGRRRKGVSKLLGELKDPSLHIRRAMELESPFADAISLPPDVNEAIDIARVVPTEELKAFLGPSSYCYTKYKA